MLDWLAGQTRLSDGTTAYYMRRTDDCWQAAVATCMGLPMHQVPDSRIDERVRRGEDPAEVERSAKEEFDRWLKARGWRMRVHRKKMPVHLDRWLGVVLLPERFQSHTLVMSRDEVLFRPDAGLAGFLAHLSIGLVQFDAEDVGVGYSFQRARPRSFKARNHNVEVKE